MKVKSLVFSATVQEFRTLQDGTLKVSLHTQEMQDDQAANLLSFRQKYTKVLLSTENISIDKVDAINSFKITEEDNGKSPSQRLRAVIYRFWESECLNGVDLPEFEIFYRSQMEKIIIHFKDKLN